MANETHFTAGQSALFYQESPNSAPIYLGCHQTDDIEETLGDVEYIYCPDESSQNKFKVVGEIIGTPEPPTTSITYDLTDAVDLMERMHPGGTLFINKAIAGRRDTFSNALRTFILYNIRATSRGLTGLTSRTPDDNARSEQSADITASGLIRFKSLTPTTQTIANITDAVDVSFWSYDRARTPTQTAMRAGDRGFIADTTKVYSTSNGGSTWTAGSAVTATNIFGNGAVIKGIESFELAPDQIRLLVVESDQTSPLKVAYSDNYGVNYNVTNVAATTEGAPTRNSLYVYDRNNCWIGTTAGKIYKSEDGGVTWSLNYTMSGTAVPFNAIHFSSSAIGYVVGDSNFAAKTSDNGETWETITTIPAGNYDVVSVIDSLRAWVGTDAGKLYFTNDGGATWSERAIGLSSAPITGLEFMFDGQIGYMSTNVSNVGRVYYTIDGGYTWTLMTNIPTNTGINAIDFSDLYSVYVVGQSGFISKLGL